MTDDEEQALLLREAERARTRGGRALNGTAAVMTAVLRKVMGVMSQQTSVTLEASARAQARCFLKARRPGKVTPPRRESAR